MTLRKRVLSYYSEYLAKSAAATLKVRHPESAKSDHWSECKALHKMYETMRPTGAPPAFLELDHAMDLSADKRNHTDLTELPIGVIVETREHPHLEYVIRNFIEQTGLSVQLFHSPNNVHSILRSDLSAYIQSKQLSLFELKIDQLTGSIYNGLFLSKRFWNAMIGRGKIFVFQTDSCICPNSPFALNDFLAFDYIGSKWSRKRPNGLILDGGSGGLSIRDWDKSIKCLERFDPTLWQSGEDGYFAFHIELLGGRVGKSKDCGQFSTQDMFAHKSYGAHQISRLPVEQQQQFIDFCPEAQFLL